MWHNRAVLGELVTVSYRRPVLVLCLWALVAVLGSLGLARLKIETSLDSLLDRADPAWSFYESSKGRFGGDQVVVVALEGEAPFDARALSEVDELTRDFERLPGARRVDSLATLPIVRVRPHDQTLLLDPALVDGELDEPDPAASTADVVLADRVAVRSVVAEDGRAFAINVLPHPELEEFEPLLEGVGDALDGHRAWVSGVPIFRRQITAETEGDILLFLPLTVAIIAGFMLGVFRSPGAAALSLATGACGTYVLLAAMGATGVSLTVTTMILPSISLAFGCAYVMHVLAVAAGRTREGEAGRALVSVALPIALSGLTTGIGFAATGLVRIDAVRNMGIFGSIAVAAILAATLTLAPAALRLRPIHYRVPALSGWIRGRLQPALLSLAGRHRRALIGVWLVALVGLGAGLTRITVETDVTLWFRHGTHVRDSYETIRALFAGISPINVVIEADGDHLVTAPEALAAIDELAAYLNGLPDVGKAVSYADPLRHLHGGFLGDPSLPLPDSEELIDQYLLLLESVEHLGDLITDDRLAANVLLRVDNNGSDNLRAVAERAEDWWRKHGPPGFSARATGIMFEFARVQDAISWGQLQGLIAAAVVITVLMLVIFRWPLLAMIAVLTNLVPIFFIFGFMGLVGIPLDAGTVLMGSLALGIAVDDTIHVTVHFFDERRRGAPARRALESSLDRVLPAVIYTTLAISLGFLVLALSEFTFVRNLGLLTCCIMVLCLAANVTLLPALLLGLQAPAPRRAVAGPPLEARTG